MAAGPITVPGGAELIGAPTVHRLMVALEAVHERGCCSLFDTAHAVLALEDGAKKEGLLVQLAAEALFYSNNLREEREADENTRTVTLTDEAQAVRFDIGVCSVEPPRADVGTITVTEIGEVTDVRDPTPGVGGLFGEWACRCGGINQLSERVCHDCGASR